MSKPFRNILLGVAGLLVVMLACQWATQRQLVPVQVVCPVTPVTTASQTGTNLAGQSAVKAGAADDRLLHLRRDQVLATVNGCPVTVADLLPVGTNDSPADLEVSALELNFLLKRAVDRELIFQTAKERGLSLDDGESRQLANLTSMRHQPEPGGLANLNGSAAQRSLELQDAQAFLLQTDLMAAQGVSPNVTEDQVTAYYQAHQSEYGELPADPGARSQAWAKIDFSIREQLAPSIRSGYNDKLAAYMAQMEASANVVMTPFGQSSGND